MTSLPDFLLARIADDEAVAREVESEMRREIARGLFAPSQAPDPDADFGMWHADGNSGYATVGIGVARVLADCASKRAIVLACRADYEYSLTRNDDTMELATEVLINMAQPHADHEGFESGWVL